MLREGCGRRGEGDDALVGALVGKELNEGSVKSRLQPGMECRSSDRDDPLSWVTESL